MTKEEAAWVAGILEGEGCFSIKERSISVQCGMSDEDVVAHLHLLTGVGTMNGPRILPDRKPLWTWCVMARGDVVNLLVALRPFMGSRRGCRIDAMLDWNEANPLYRERKDAAKHGSLGMYSNHNCRCDICTSSWQEYQRARYSKDPERFRSYSRKHYWNDIEHSRRLGRERARRQRKVLVDRAESALLDKGVADIESVGSEDVAQ